MRPRYQIELTEEERELLSSLTRTGKTNARKCVYARALLLCDSGPHSGGQRWKVAEVATALGISERTIEHLKKRYIHQGMLAFDPARRIRRTERKFDGNFEAHLIATACSPSPEGHVYWTLSLLAQKMVELKIVDSVSTSTVQRTLKKTNYGRI